VIATKPGKMREVVAVEVEIGFPKGLLKDTMTQDMDHGTNLVTQIGEDVHLQVRRFLHHHSIESMTFAI
jgi:hypothetical protein